MTTLEYLRQFRFLGYAIFDLGVSFLGMLILSPLLTMLFRKAHIEIPWWSWVLFTLPLGIVFHLAFNAMTPMTKQFLNLNGDYVLKAVIVAFCILGALGVRSIKK